MYFPDPQTKQFEAKNQITLGFKTHNTLSGAFNCQQSIFISTWIFIQISERCWKTCMAFARRQ